MTTSTERSRPSGTEDVPSDRDLVRKHLEDRRKFWTDLVAYVVINGFLVAAWAMGDRGSFWPGWVLSAWGVFLLIDAYRVFFGAPITDSDVDAELSRRQQRR